MIGSSLAGTHTRFSRLLRDRLIRKHTDPDLPAAFYVPRHRDTCRLDLPVGDPTRIESLQSIITEVEIFAARGLSAHTALHHSSVLDLFRHQHNCPTSINDS